MSWPTPPQLGLYDAGEFLLGVCYEFNREPGEITRATIHPIVNRLGVKTLIGRMARLREDNRFKSVGPDVVILPYPTPQHLQHALKGEAESEKEKEKEDTDQRGLSTDPGPLSSSASGQSLE
ncbi:hypothetical protein C8R47DRAFT_1199218 [Mycena vitilis]|nr:hypothetical protein C8R47DRAFT_1199218 [Mycena vitilis]